MTKQPTSRILPWWKFGGLVPLESHKPSENNISLLSSRVGYVVSQLKFVRIDLNVLAIKKTALYFHVSFYIYIYIYTHTHTHIHTLTLKERKYISFSSKKDLIAKILEIKGPRDKTDSGKLARKIIIFIRYFIPATFHRDTLCISTRQ